MIITLVIDQFGVTNNGTTVTAVTLAKVLKEHGHTVRVVTTNAFDENTYQVPVNHFPILYQVAKSQGMVIAKAKEAILRKAIDGSDVVHFYLPFPLQKLGSKIANELHVPMTTAFHLQPQNITYTLHLEKWRWLNRWIYRYFLKNFYHQFSHIHCPSKMIEQQLIANHYPGKFHVVSNGVNPIFHKKESRRPQELEGKFLVLMVGRLSREKRQDLIIEAVKISKYQTQIQIIFAGQGPWYKKLKRKGKKLTNPPIFGFYQQSELIEVFNYCDLYIHASDAEIEGISCIEAITCGLVPVISDSPLSATNEFALTKENLFIHGDVLDLKTKIDYFIEHPQEKQFLSNQYVAYAQNFVLDHCVRQLERMFEDAIEEQKRP